LIETTTLNKKFNLVSDHKQSQLLLVSSDKQPQVKVLLAKEKEQEEVEYDLDMLIDIKGWKAIGNKLSSHKVLDVKLLNSISQKEEGAENSSEGNEEDIEIGSTVEFKIKKDDEEEQLGLF
jgi:topoisomerase-4 subunit A